LVLNPPLSCGAGGIIKFQISGMKNIFGVAVISAE